MKLTQVLFVSAIASTVFFSATAQAFSPRETSDIAEGKSFKVTNGEEVSYYKDGKSGEVNFTCTLSGEHVNAILYPSKNFLANLPAILESGNNGPYKWKLHKVGYDYGKINVRLLRGEEAVIQCKLT